MYLNTVGPEPSHVLSTTSSPLSSGANTPAAHHHNTLNPFDSAFTAHNAGNPIPAPATSATATSTASTPGVAVSTPGALSTTSPSEKTKKNKSKWHWNPFHETEEEKAKRRARKARELESFGCAVRADRTFGAPHWDD